MLDRISPVKTAAWRALSEHYSDVRGSHMKDLFRNDPDRFARFSLVFNDIILDFSKNIITEETMHLLLDLAEETGVYAAIESMFRGEIINET
jgi:glucose-6-phosphate isomerase